MNVEWLRYFVILSEMKNFHQAAKKLEITPPTLSNAVNELENYYKFKLINRDHKFNGLTPAGLHLLEQSKSILESVNILNNSMYELNSKVPEGPVSIAGEEIALDFFLPEILSGLLLKFPKIFPSLYSMRSSIVEKAVKVSLIK